MPDRIIHQSATLYADLPTNQQVSVIVTNPLNQVIAEDESAQMWAPGRFRYYIPTVDVSGIWEVVWDDGNLVRRTATFSVGPRPPVSVTKWDIKTEVVARTDNHHVGRVQEAYADTLVDPTILGDYGNYTGWWIVVNELGTTIPRRVISFSGSGFVVAPQFTSPIPAGTEYILSPIPPDELDTHLRTTMAGLSEIARIEVHVPNVPITSAGDTSEIPIPRGVTHVHSLSIGDTDIPSRMWTMRTGRRLQFTTDEAGEFASIIGIRAAGYPQWEDSFLDFDSEAVQARVAALVHAGRARGQAQDTDEHLRRQLTAMDEYMLFRRVAAGRPYPGAQAVID